MSGADTDGTMEFSYRGELRRGGYVGVGHDAIVVVRDDERIRVAIEDIVEVSARSVDWFLAVLSVGLVGFGLYSVPMSVLGGIAFAVAGVFSLYWTYRRRNELKITVADRRKPIAVYPTDLEACYRAIERENETGA